MIIINEANRLAYRSLRISHALNYQFSSPKDNKMEKKDNITAESLGNYQGMIYTMRKDAELARSQRNQQKALFKHNKKVQDHLVELTYYMRHDHWKSQFIYLLLNYYKLGFKLVSDYAFLDSSSYVLELRNLKEQDRWPSIRVIVGLKPRVIVTGAEQIEKFFIQNMYFHKSYISDIQQSEVAKKFIDEQILPYMQSLLWHPTLTYQTTFHTDSFYHQSEQKNYMLVEILLRNFSKCGKAMLSNIFKIFKQKQRYLTSKEKFTNALREMSELYLKNNEFFDGDRPGFIDFYLFSHFRTKWDSKYFKDFLQQQISDQFKRWLLRMGCNCDYSRDRVTVL